MDLKRYLGKRNGSTQQKSNASKFSEKLRLSKNVHEQLSKFNKDYRGAHNCIFNHHNIQFNSPFWFLHSVDEIFVEEVYKFLPESDAPTILDCGANIGLSVLYFKELSKNAKIIAFEPDPSVFKQLENNVAEYKYSDIKLVNAAVWNSETKIVFSSEGSVGGKIDFNETNSDNNIEIPTIRLRDYLSTQIDFLKIDIEGAEYQVLEDCADLLPNVKNLFIEYHVMPDEEQHLHEILNWVNKAGFKYYIREAWSNMSYPYLKMFKDFYQMQLNIFCYK